ncbi:hypothetical protein cbdbA704 [Dehalococcoides mccartyi CBDB1]|uniref:Uncharacterized protein n=1 Tax=Dehalococcoides mccartyi (strain CBDB1) TaxID=255470 RepID=A0A916KM77_DEHMC|nr:hypothetical protein cbdbA704 [Dehalococcoides mccartyi CBDB1]
MKGCGKSNLAATLLDMYGSTALVYDTLSEYPDTAAYDRYVPANRYNSAELEKITRAVMRSRRYRLFIIDEANRYCPSKPSPLPQAIADLNDWCRHEQYDIVPVYLCRRPTQLNQDLTEQADYLCIFRLAGVNDVKYLNELSAGLGDTVRQLSQYHFVMVDQARNYQVMRPVKKAIKSNH